MKNFQYSPLNIRCITEVLWFKHKNKKSVPIYNCQHLNSFYKQSTCSFKNEKTFRIIS